MKLQAANDFDVQVVGSNTSSSFSIAMNGKAFRVLSSTLYQNKIGSIVREISCNAVDGHTMAGKKDEPFQIHLPDMFEPWFSVRDFGVGMDRATIQNVFTKYFESTKDQSNDAIGAFGLGAKTPFSYTDQFTITSIVNGEKVVYSAYIQNDLPSIDEMHSEPTTEPQGVEIKISVKKEDYSKFKGEVAEQLQYFPVKPVIFNGDVIWPKKEIDVSTDLYTLYKNVSYNQRGIFIVQGNVGYKLAAENIKDASADIVTFIHQVSGNYSLSINFPIGTIGVTASREGVEYDPKTVANIIDRLTLVRNEMGAEINKRIADCTSDFERVATYYKLTALQMSMVDKSKFPTAKFADRWISVESVVSNNKVRTHTVQVSTPSRKTLKYTAGGSITLDAMNGDNNYLILLKDTSNHLQKRVDKAREQGFSMVYVFGNHAGDMTDAECNAMKAEIAKITGGFPNVNKVSEVVMPVAERKKYSRTGPLTKFILLDTDGSVEKISDPIDSIEGEFIYAEIERLTTEKVYALTTYDQIRRIRILQERNGEEVLPVVFVNEKGLAKIEKLSNVKHRIQDYLNSYCKVFDRESLKRKYIAERAKIMAGQRVDFGVRSFLNEIEDDVLVVDQNVAKVAKFVKNYSGATRVETELQLVAEMLGWNNNVDVTASVMDCTDKITAKFLNTGSKNMVVKWLFNDSYATNRLPKQDLIDTMVMYAKNRV